MGCGDLLQSGSYKILAALEHWTLGVDKALLGGGGDEIQLAGHDAYDRHIPDSLTQAIGGRKRLTGREIDNLANSVLVIMRHGHRSSGYA